MQKFMSSEQVAERVLDHIANRSTDRGSEVWREPAENYRSPERLEDELAVMQSVPTAFCPSIAIDKPGDYIAREAAGTPLIVVRAKDGQVRAFKNACRHRGTQLVSGAGCAKTFVCPYHGWTYGLDGALRGVPHAKGFPCLDKNTHGLAELTTFERNGLVFVLQKPPNSNTGSALAMLEGIPDVLSPDQIIFAQSEGTIEANWKLFLESFLEGYHIKSAHAETFFPFGYDNLNVIEFCGLHSRVTFPFQRIEKWRETPPEKRNISDKVTFVNHLFPNIILAELSHHRTLAILEPVNTAQTRMTAFHITKSTDNLDQEAVLETAKRDLAFVNQTGQQEDIAMVSGIQRSLHSGANDYFTFGHFEPAIVHFHKQLKTQLEQIAGTQAANV